MPNYKLIYFNLRGRAELCRLLFALAGVPYEDVRYSKEEWAAKEKANSKFGALPEIEIDGVKYTQSRAIMYYLAREFGLYPSNSIDALRVDEIIFILDDLFNQAAKTFHGTDEEKAASWKNFEEIEIPKYLGRIEKLLQSSGGEFATGDKVTLADVAIFELGWGLQRRHVGCTDSFPLLTALVEKVGNLDRIKEWLEKRPVTLM